MSQNGPQILVEQNLNPQQELNYILELLKLSDEKMRAEETHKELLRLINIEKQARFYGMEPPPSSFDLNKQFKDNEELIARLTLAIDKIRKSLGVEKKELILQINKIIDERRIHKISITDLNNEIIQLQKSLKEQTHIARNYFDELQEVTAKLKETVSTVAQLTADKANVDFVFKQTQSRFSLQMIEQSNRYQKEIEALKSANKKLIADPLSRMVNV